MTNISFGVKELTDYKKSGAFLSLFLSCFFCVTVVKAQDISNIAKEKPFSLDGQIGANGNFYSSDGVNRQQPFTWGLYGNLNAKIYGVAIPFSFIISEQQRTYTQPFDQFGINPKYKWITLHLGYSRMIFSPFTLAGSTFLGAGVELKPKNNFRLSAMKGRFQRAVNEIQNSPLNISPAYLRTGYAVKAGYGTDANHVDFIYLKAMDDSTSLTHIPVKTETRPQDNTVMGINVRSLIKKKLQFDLDLAQTQYHKNLFSADGAIKRLAVDATAGYLFSSATLKLEYKRVEPDFKSLGAYYIEADIQQITFQPSCRIFKNKLQLNGSVGFQQDNLMNEKPVTTNRIVYAANINFNPVPAYGLAVQYSNYGVTQQHGTQPLNDTIKISQVLSNLTISNRILLKRKKNVQTIVLTTVFQKTDDRNQFTSEFTQSNVQIVNLAYVFTPLAPGGVGFNAGLFNNKIGTAAGNFVTNGFSIGASRCFMDKKVQTNMSFTYAATQFSNTGKGNTNCFTAGLIYNVTKHHRLLLNVNYLKVTSESILKTSFSEVRVNLGYVYTF